MTEAASGKSLKNQNRRRLWIVIAVNCLVLYAFTQTRDIGDLDAKAILARTTDLVPVGMALAVVSVINGLVTADYKYRIVFLRWRHSLPGHRAFSQYALSDPRIDVERIKEVFGGDLSTDPVQQNKVWFNTFYRKVENESCGSRRSSRVSLYKRLYHACSSFFHNVRRRSRFCRSLVAALCYLLCVAHPSVCSGAAGGCHVRRPFRLHRPGPDYAASIVQAEGQPVKPSMASKAE